MDNQEKARLAAFKIMTAQSTSCTVDQMINSWENDDANHPDLVLWSPFENMDFEFLLETFDMLVESHLQFASEPLRN
jgi:hypothetical protein